MDVVQTVDRLGGAASWRELRATHTRRAIESAVRRGTVVHLRRDLYATPRASEHQRAAMACAGVMSHLSAALHHGWRVKEVPALPWVTIPRSWGTRSGERPPVHLRHSDLAPDDVAANVTSPLRTVLDCARALPFDEALAVADSSLRSRDVGRDELRAAAALARGPGSAAVKRVAAHAHPAADNPLESVLRALTIEAGLRMTPQLRVVEQGLFATVDLGNEELRLIIEAEGYETHGTRRGLRRDCQRHTEFAVFGWSSMRYAYEHVMFEQAWVLWSLRSWLRVRSGLHPTAPPRRTLRRAG